MTGPTTCNARFTALAAAAGEGYGVPRFARAGQPAGWRIRSEGKRVVRQTTPAGGTELQVRCDPVPKAPSPGNNDPGVQV